MFWSTIGYVLVHFYRGFAWLMVPRTQPLAGARITRRVVSTLRSVLGVVIVLFASVVTNWTDLDRTVDELSVWYLGLFEGLFIIGAAVLVSTLVFTVAAFFAAPGQRIARLLRSWLPSLTFFAYMGIMALCLISPRWTIALLAQIPADWDVLFRGAVWIVVMCIAVLFALLLWSGLLIGTYFGTRYLFRSADAHPLFPLLVTMLLAIAAGYIGISQLLDGGAGATDAPLRVFLLLSGPVATAVLTLIEFDWLRRDR